MQDGLAHGNTTRQLEWVRMRFKMGAIDMDIPTRYLHIFMSVVQRAGIVYRWGYTATAAAAAGLSIGSQGCIVCNDSGMSDGHVDVSS